VKTAFLVPKRYDAGFKSGEDLNNFSRWILFFSNSKHYVKKSKWQKSTDSRVSYVAKKALVRLRFFGQFDYAFS
jgi:hypothetical protein